MELENIVANTVYLKARESKFGWVVIASMTGKQREMYHSTSSVCIKSS